MLQIEGNNGPFIPNRGRIKTVLGVVESNRQVLAVLSQGSNCYFCLLRPEVKVPAIHFKWLEEKVRWRGKIHEAIRNWISTPMEAVFF